jgi:hypothetical protein
MPPGQPGPVDGRPGRVPYVIGAEPSLLVHLTQMLSIDPEVTLTRMGGSPTWPSLPLAEMTADRAQTLRAHYGSRVSIKPDAPLTSPITSV